MSPLSMAAARRLHGNTSILCHRSVPLCIDAATGCFSKAEKDDDKKQTQTVGVPNIIVNSSTAVRHYSCYPHIFTPLQHFSSNNNITQTFTMQKREYHTTSRNEILPFIAVGVLGATTVYTYRALEQMDKDWDEYYDKVEEYKSKTGIDPEKEHSTVSKQIDEKKEDNKSS